MRTRQPRRLRIEALERRELLAFDPTPFEQEMFELVNRMRMYPESELDALFSSHPTPLTAYDSDIQSAVNFFGVDGSVLESQWASLVAVPPLAWNEELYNAARGHSQAMIDQDQQAHQVTGEASFGQRLQDSGYDDPGQFDMTSAGENIYAYSESPVHAHGGFAIDWGSTATGIQDPPGHRNNIMSSSFREIGIGVLEDNDGGTAVGPYVVTQDFGNRTNSFYGDPRIIGVAFSDANSDGFYNQGEGLSSLDVEIDGTGGTFNLTTLTAGGFQQEVPAGEYTITLSGGSLSEPIARNVVVGSDNIKVDFNTQVQAFDIVARNPNNDNWSVAVSNGAQFTWETWGSGFPSSVVWQDWAVADFNGDGLHDIAARNPNNNNFSVGVSDGASFSWQPWGGAFPIGATWENLVVGDFDGDGRDDIAGRNAANNNWSLAASSGSSFSWQNWAGGFSPQVAWQNWMVGDFNGDGRDDIAARNPNNNNWSVDVSGGSGFTWERWQGAFPASVTWQNWTVGDFNGDGNADLAARNPNNHNWSVAISDGSSFSWENWQGGFPTTVSWEDWQVGDYNGDGSDDVVARNPNNNNFSVGISDGSSFNWEPWGGAFATSVSWQTWLTEDFTGDGRDDIAARNPGNNNWSLATSDGSSFTWERWGGAFSTAVTWANWDSTDAAPLPAHIDLTPYDFLKPTGPSGLATSGRLVGLSSRAAQIEDDSLGWVASKKHVGELGQNRPWRHAQHDRALHQQDQQDPSLEQHDWALEQILQDWDDALESLVEQS